MVVYDRVRVEPTLDVLPGGRRRRARRRASTASSRSAAARASTPPRSPTSSPRTRRRSWTTSTRRSARGASRRRRCAAPRDPDHLRDRRGGHHGGGARHPRPEGQDRDLASLPAPRTRGSSTPSSCARCRRRSPSSTGLDVICHAAESLPRRGPTTSARGPRRPTTGRPTRAPTRSPTCGRRKALEYGGRYLRRAVDDADDLEARGRDDARRHDGRRRLRLGRRAHPARVRLSDRRPQARLPAARLPRRPPVRAARPLGDRHRAGRVPLHLRGRRPSATTAWPSCSPASRSPTPGADTLPDVLRALMRDVGAPRGDRASSATTRTTCPRSSRARSSSSACSSSARARSAAEDLGHILNASMANW